MATRAIAAGIVAALLGGCSSTPPPAPALDAKARATCEAFAPIAAEVRAGGLAGAELYRALQDVWDLAQQAESTAVRNSAQALLTAAIQNDRTAVSAGVTALQQACNLPFQ